MRGVVGIMSIGLLIVGALLVILIRRIWLTAITLRILLWGSTVLGISYPFIVQDGKGSPLITGVALRIAGVISAILSSLLAMLETTMLWRTVRIHPLWRTIASRGVTILWCRRRITSLLAITLRLVMLTLSRIGRRR